MRRTLTWLAAAAACAAALVGCSPAPGDAAVVGDRHISQAYLEQTLVDLEPLLADPVPSNVLSVLLVAPAYIEAAASNGVGVSTEQAMDLLTQNAETAGILDATFGAGAVEVARFSLAMSNLQGLADGAAVLAEVEEAVLAQPIEVNPRYGVVDQATGVLSATVRPWIAATETP